MKRKSNKSIRAAPKRLSVAAPEQLYEVDFFKWANTQANLLKRGEFEKLDILNLREEIESLGRSEKRSLKHYIENWLMHKLKIEYQAKRRTNSWDLSVENAQYMASDVIKDNPSLKPKLKEIYLTAYHLARNSAAIETGLDVEIFPEECPWSLKDIFPDLEKKYQ